MTNKTPRVAKNRRESTTPGTRKTGKLFFFLSSSSFFFRQLSSMLPQSVTMVFARNSSIFNRAVQRPIAFSLPPSLHISFIIVHVYMEEDLCGGGGGGGGLYTSLLCSIIPLVSLLFAVLVSLHLASNPGAEEGEKSAWYPLFAHALNFPTFRESWIRPRHSRGLLTSDTCSLPYHDRILSIMATLFKM